MIALAVLGFGLMASFIAVEWRSSRRNRNDTARSWNEAAPVAEDKTSEFYHPRHEQWVQPTYATGRVRRAIER